MTTTPALSPRDAARTRLRTRLNKGINLLADRDDLLLDIEWDPSPADPPAWFQFDARKVTINAVVALGETDPATVNPLTPEGRRKHPVVVGLCCHEAAHAHSTVWDAEKRNAAPSVVVKAATLLEEPRIEKRQLDRRPGDRLFLRAQSMLLDAPSAHDKSVVADRWRCATVALFTLGRVDAGVLDVADVRPVLTLCRKGLGQSDFTALRKIWQEALELPDGDTEALLDAAARWVELVGADEDSDVPGSDCSETGDGPSLGEPCGGDGSDSDSGSADEEDHAGPPSTSDDKPGDDEIDKLAEAFAKAMNTVSNKAKKQAAAALADGNDRYDSAKAAADAAQAKADAAAKAAAEADADRVFHGYGSVGKLNPLRASRIPTADEYRIAKVTGDALRKAQFRERTAKKVSSHMPPGRLVGRDAMLGAAQRQRGMLLTAKPFRSVVRKHAPEPPLCAGIAVDVSGSMAWATEIMGTVGWSLARAVNSVGGRSAMVAFGETVTAVTRPGEVPENVPSFVAGAGHEVFSDAVRVLDGGLNLSAGSGARLVFVVSDGHYGKPGEEERANRAVQNFVKNGVKVLWLNAKSAQETCTPEGAVHVFVEDVKRMPEYVSAALVEALRANP